MRRLSVWRMVPAEPSVVWDLLVDTSRWPEWGPSIVAAEVAATAEDTAATAADRDRISAGATGRVRTVLGPWVPFRITSYEEGRSWSWAVAGIGATDHRVEPAPGGCRVTFGAPILAAPYLAVCRIALGRIERIAVGSGRGNSRSTASGGGRPDGPDDGAV